MGTDTAFSADTWHYLGDNFGFPVGMPNHIDWVQDHC